jgi:hypothetical protein
MTYEKAVRSLINRGWVYEGDMFYKPSLKDPSTGLILKFTMIQAAKIEKLELADTAVNGI